MIHQTAIVDRPDLIDVSAEIKAYCILRGPVSIGRGSKIGPYTSIGEVAEHGSEKFDFKPRGAGGVMIGQNVVIREFVTVNAPMDALTIIHDSAYIMSHSHISHDNVIGHGAIIATGVILGGWSTIMDCAYMGLGSITHQRTTVGAYAIVAAGSTLVKDLPPLSKYIPGKPLGINTVAIERHKLPPYDHNHPDYAVMRKIWEDKRDHSRSFFEFEELKNAPGGVVLP